MTDTIDTPSALALGNAGSGFTEPGSAAPDLETALRLEARQFEARSHANEGKGQGSLRLAIADFEFAYDRGAHGGYRVAEGADAETSIRWPFHRIACASWMILRFDPGAEVPVVEEITTLAHDEADEKEIVARLFGSLELHADVPLVTWGGESKDLAVLRRVASEAGLLLPPQLLDPNPFSRRRLDLCRAVAGGARFPHLPEYAAGTGVPCKPSPAKEVGPLVEREEWAKVRDQCLADVLTTSVIALRHLTSHGIITCHPQRGIAAIAEGVAKAVPQSPFVRSSFAPWARARLSASRLSGTVYRPD